jgi:hypothetical protein
LGECGDWGGGGFGDAGGGSANIPPMMELLTPHVQTGLGSGGGEGAGGIVACRVRGTVGLPVPVAGSSARPPRIGGKISLVGRALALQSNGCWFDSLD